MENCLAEYGDQAIAPYVNDVLVYSKIFDDHVAHLQQTLHQFRERRLNSNHEIASYFRKKSSFLVILWQ